MNKKTKYAVNGGLVGGVGMAVWNIWEQLNSDTEKQFDWRALFVSFLKGAAIGAAGGFTIGAICDYRNSKETPIDTDATLLALINTVRLNPKNEEYLNLYAKSEWLMHTLDRHFYEKLKSQPFRFGSTEKGTALAENFDIDICLSFVPKSYSSIEEMYYTVFDFLSTLQGINGITRIRDQKKSIGVFFIIDGEEKKIDVLPQKITKPKRKATSGYLYVNNQGVFEKPSRTKTDVKLLNSVTLSEPQKKILVALKKWKQNNSIPISSHLLQYLILDAYECNTGFIPRQFTDKVIMVFNHIKDNIESLQLCSIENTNNVLTNMPPDVKAEIKKACKQVIDNYEYQPNSIVQIIK